jgi:hypothetical protein
MVKGPNGMLYTSGYFSGGAARFDPATGKAEELSGIGQSEGITSLGNKVYFGVYPGARIMEASADGEWKPKELFSLKKSHEQDRPFAMIGVEKENKVFMGTVPDYGLLGGALVIYDPAFDHHEVHRNVVKDQAVVSLAYLDGKIYGGTSISGGLGVKPTETEGKLFIWDVAKNEKITEIVPAPGKIVVSSLNVGPDSNIWGWAEGVLFVYSPSEQKVIYSDEKLPLDYKTVDHVWRDAHMELHADGNFYGVINSKLFRLDPETKDFTLLHDAESGMHEFAIDEKGAMYTVHWNKLLRIKLDNKKSE